jgi:hypothetical protein
LLLNFVWSDQSTVLETSMITITPPMRLNNVSLTLSEWSDKSTCGLLYYLALNSNIIIFLSSIIIMNIVFCKLFPRMIQIMTLKLKHVWQMLCLPLFFLIDEIERKWYLNGGKRGTSKINNNMGMRSLIRLIWPWVGVNK